MLALNYVLVAPNITAFFFGKIRSFSTGCCSLVSQPPIAYRYFRYTARCHAKAARPRHNGARPRGNADVLRAIERHAVTGPARRHSASSRGS
jgi:hypothetical protein